MKKKVMMCSSVHVWNDTRIYFKEAISLANRGYQVDFYAIDYEAEKVEIENLNMHYLPPHKRFSRPLLWLRLYKIAKKKEFDYFHFHDPELLLVSHFLKKTLSNKVSYIYDMHEHLPAAIKTKPWIPKVFRQSVSNLVDRIEKKLMKSLDAVIFAEKSYKENYRTLDIEQEDLLNYPKMVTKNTTLKKADIFTLVYVGGLIEQRGLFNMLELAKELKNNTKMGDFRMRLIGPMLSNKAEVENFIKVNELTNHIVIYPRLSYSDIWRHYQESHIGMCLLHPTPNNLNSSSTKLYEYMVAGLPVIASDFPQFKQLLQKYDCGDVGGTEDVSKFVKDVLYYYHNEKERAQKGANGQNLEFSWASQEAKMYDLYKYLSLRKDNLK
ncbi:glycosyltransferase family 4 protein [Listeria rocourtiae]|uniref:glycosyltransferase n=1 Tax=Listeria rocourtiae TaxID=647910 RepID=UPI001624ACA0|nr:glycosyltransferase [Listeria rocourtiae]MBC1605351.1 glycosyltransferase family 4 protein [Listeria rocourtiae]